MFSPMLLWEERHVYAANANDDANIVDKQQHSKKCPMNTYYFDSFSNIVFVSSSVSGLILGNL